MQQLIAFTYPPGEASVGYAPANFVSSASGQMELCLIRFWYSVSLGSGFSREGSLIYFWNLTSIVVVAEEIAVIVRSVCD